MTDSIKHDKALFDGLQALTDASFPKQCATCGRVYESAEDYVQQTEDVNGKSGLKASYDDDDSPIVELFRNCVCGSTLMDCFRDRRSPAAIKRREVFGKLLDLLSTKGLDKGSARTELLKVMAGERSETIENYGIKLPAARKKE